MGLGARVRHTGSPAAQSSIPVIPGSRGVVMRNRVVTSHALPLWLVDATETGGQGVSPDSHPAYPEQHPKLQTS